MIEKTLKLPNVRAVQTDFDVAKSEREFYRTVITKLKAKLLPEMPLTITSLASWCVGDEGGQYTFATRWWCEPYSTYYDDYDENSVPAASFPRPPFLKKAQADAGLAEMKKLKAIGDAPKYLGKNVLEWAKLRPKDKRIPESLYIVYESNGWDKYGCGNDEDLRNAAASLLRAKYPDSEWTAKLESEDEQ